MLHQADQRPVLANGDRTGSAKLNRAATAVAVLGVLPIGGIALPVINCAHFRADSQRQSCIVGMSPSVAHCVACEYRVPLVTLTPPDPVQMRRCRGMGDLLHAVIRVAFLGRVDIAERMASRVEALWRKPVPQAATPGKPGPSGGCGCAARREALNRAIPFGKD